MALAVDADWFQLRLFISGDEIIISDQFVSKSCAFVRYEFFHCHNLRFVLRFYDSGDYLNIQIYEPPVEKYSQQGVRVFTALVR